MKLKKILFIVLVFSCNILFAQQTEALKKQNKDFAEAIHLFDQQKYSAAQQVFFKIAESAAYSQSVRIDAQFFAAICALKLFNGDAELLIKHFIEKNPESPRIFHAYFEYANFLFREQNFTDALIWYQLVDTRKFSNMEIAEFFYKFGYTYFKNNEFAKAKPLFFEVKDSESLYAENSLYYYSYLEYVDKNFDIALKGFEKLADSSLFSTVVPPYICQIYYHKQEYDKLIQYARSIEDIINPGQLPDVYRVLAGAYFKTLQYNNALPYFEKYISSSPSPSKEDYYELGYLYYRNGQYQKAIQNFQNVTSQNDTIAQNAYYHLGDCYLKLGDKDKARNAFMAAMQYSVFPYIKEDATFIHAKLIYELSYAPFNEAITAMQAFILEYPKSKYKDEANSLLVKIFMSSKNYKDALISLENISNLTSDLKIAYQQIAYYRGLELFNNLEFTQAIAMFDKSMKYGMYDRSINSFCIYWKAEALYKLDDFSNARKLFNDFIVTPGAFQTEEYKRAHYNIAYTFFEQEQFSSAVTWYRKYLEIASNKKNDFYADAAIRTGDCYYMLKEFTQAIKYYTIAIDINSFDIEYALFQEAFCQGLAGNQESKIKSLTKFLQRFPSSMLYDDALFEQAEAYIKVGDNAKAIANYNNIVTNFRASSYIKKSLLQLAFLDYNANKLDEALIMYKRVVEQYPGSQEMQTALNMIRNIHKKKNDIEGYSQYVKQLGGYASVTDAELDSLSFEVAQELFLNGDCDKAQPLLKGYIQKYAEGFFVINAHFYHAECFFNNGFEFEALPHYEYVLQHTKNNFTEKSMVNASHIAIQQSQFEKALKYLTRLEREAEIKQNLLVARRGQLVSYFALQDFRNVIDAGEKYIATEKISQADKRWANIHIAYAYEALQDTIRAMTKYRTVAIEHATKEGSESKYKIALFLFAQKKYEECEKEIIDFLEKNSPHQYWLGKSYLLWAQIFIKRNELFQARYTLQNVLQHYKNEEDGIKNEANDLLNLITDIEIQQKQKTAEEIVIPMGDNPELFNKQ